MRALVITLLDVEQEPNQRVHHVIRMLERSGAQTVVASKQRAHGRSPRALLRDSLAFRVRASRAGRVTTLAVHPPLNYAHAMASGLRHGAGSAPPAAQRRALAAALSLLGIARDAALVPAFVLAILWGARGRFELCVAQGPWEAAVGCALRALGRVDRLLYDDIDYVPGMYALAVRRAAVAWLERALMRRADAVVSAGWRLARERARSTGRAVHTVPNGVDAQRFRRRRAPRAQRPPALVYAGNLAHYCGADLAIAALPLLRAHIPQLRLHIAGGGDPPYVTGLAQLAAECGAERAVAFHGPLPYSALPELFAQCDIGLALSRPGPLRDFAFPLKVLEYLAAGLAVIGTAGSQGAELVERFRCGSAVPFQAQALADAVLMLLADPRAQEQLARRATRAARQYSWARSMDALRAIALPERAPDAARGASR